MNPYLALLIVILVPFHFGFLFGEWWDFSRNRRLENKRLKREKELWEFTLANPQYMEGGSRELAERKLKEASEAEEKFLRENEA